MRSEQQSHPFLRADLWETWQQLETDQKKRLPPPPLQKPFPNDAPLVALISPEEFRVGTLSVRDAIAQRASRRQFTGEPLSLEELSFLLWATQGIHEVFRGGVATRRTVPSAGARHPLETYLLINGVESVTPGLYRYLALEHVLCQLSEDADRVEQVDAGCYGQYVKKSAVVLVWTAIPYRTAWRYSKLSPKLIALDAGHVCQNLYLACESLGVGTCAIGAYNQQAMDAAIGVDGEDEFVVYIAPVGRTPS